jgi:hypothetical protein
MKKIIRSSLLNIDSTHRNICPKNITISNTNKVLPNNPLTLTQGSNIITIKYPNHNLIQGDKIVIQNVVSMSKILSNNFYLLNNFKYLIILLPNNLIDINYKNYVNSLHINIDLYGDQLINNMLENIPLNNIIGIQKILIANDITHINIPSDVSNTLISLIQKTFDNNISDELIINNNFIFIELPTIYIDPKNNLVNINQIFKITYLHIAGINLGYINANYPINNDNYYSCQEVSNVIDNNTFQIIINKIPYINITCGGANVQIMKIINTITGYPNANDYVINLKKTFTNVVEIELISSEFPYIDLSVKKNINDKLYWQNLNDGPFIYETRIDEGSYTPATLLTKLQNNLNSTPRIISNNIMKVYNIFAVNFDANTQIVSFSSYQNVHLPNSLLIKLETINDIEYYILRIIHKNNMLNVGDTITIFGATDTTIKKINLDNTFNIYSISSNYINTTLQIYSINLNDQTYDIILGEQSQIINEVVNSESRGGENIVINMQMKIRLFFNKIDTIGDILGFKNVGDPYSITDFNYIVTNNDLYINSLNVDQVGNIINYSSGFINLAGSYNYILMYLNDIEYIYNTNKLESSFAKILLSGFPGDILFNTYIKQPKNLHATIYPISILTNLTIKFLYPDGSNVNFRNMNHSFTLKITEIINTL